MTDGHVNAPEVEARRALVLHDRSLVVDLLQLTLNHGLFVVRAARSLAERCWGDLIAHLPPTAPRRGNA